MIFVVGLQLFNHFYTPDQYPQIYTQIISNYVLYSQKLNNQEKEILIDKSLKYYNVKYINSNYDQREDWKWFDKHFHHNTCAMMNLLMQHIRFHNTKPLGISANIEWKYFTKCFDSMLADQSQYSLLKIINNSDQHYCRIITRIYTILDEIFCQHTLFSNNYHQNDLTIINKISKLMNKFAYCLINLKKNKLIYKRVKAENIFWCRLVDFNIHYKFNAKSCFLSCHNYATNYTVKNSDTSLTQHVMQQPQTLRHYILYYFIVNDWNLFKKYLNLRCKLTSNKIFDIFDQISNNPSQKEYFFSHKCTIHDRLTFIRNVGQSAISYYDNHPSIIQALQNEKYMTLLGNIAMFKECNYNGCNKKDVILKRCQKCVSVYYCSRLCQKKDWLNHRNVCKSLESRDYSINFDAQT